MKILVTFVLCATDYFHEKLHWVITKKCISSVKSELSDNKVEDDTLIMKNANDKNHTPE